MRRSLGIIRGAFALRSRAFSLIGHLVFFFFFTAHSHLSALALCLFLLYSVLEIRHRFRYRHAPSYAAEFGIQSFLAQTFAHSRPRLDVSGDSRNRS
jgi:hypothetical protein